LNKLTSLEICAGAGGQALGLEMAGFEHLALVEIDKHACMTLRENRSFWNVIEQDICTFSAKDYYGVDLLAGGIPCPPFSKAGNQLGDKDERNLFPEVIRLVSECNPNAIMIENVRGLLDSKFDSYRLSITKEVEKLGYQCFWNLFNASEYGVPQHRHRTILVGLKQEFSDFFSWPGPSETKKLTVGEVLFEEMSRNGWKFAKDWSLKANAIAPTLVGGSKKHGGPDLGPTRAREAWALLSVDGKGLVDSPPSWNFEGMPRLTVKMAALIQGFPKEWVFVGKKTPAYRQVGNAFPPPVAKVIGESIALTILLGKLRKKGVA